jgi:hypothetical protein
LSSLGFTGSRGDAAYKVPALLWRRLIERAEVVLLMEPV